MDVSALEDQYDGERIFLVGNGPSVSETPLELLTDEYSVGMNNIHEVYSETEWRPTFYYCSRRSQDLTYVRQHLEQGVTCFVNDYYSDELGEWDDLHYFKVESVLGDEADYGVEALGELEPDRLDLDQIDTIWSDDIAEAVYTYHSVYGLMQILAYLGFDDVYLLGCDLTYGYYAPHMLFDAGLDPYQYLRSQRYGPEFLRDSLRKGPFVRSLANGIALKLILSPLNPVPLLQRTFAALSDSNHFSGTYQSVPKDSRTTNDQNVAAHRLISRISSEKGFEVYNATVGGNLETHPRVDLEDVV